MKLGKVAHLPDADTTQSPTPRRRLHRPTSPNDDADGAAVWIEEYRLSA